MLEVFLLAFALAMDAFAVSIGLGAKHPRQSARRTINLAVYASIYFGVAQGIMPLLGYLLGVAIIGWFTAITSWVACIILVSLGIKVLYEAYTSDEQILAKSHHTDDVTDANIHPKTVNHKLMLSLAIATSIDAMGAGFTLNLLNVHAGLACIIIAFVTAILACTGVYLGKRSGHYLEDKAEILGGLVLIAIGIKMLMD